MAPPFLILGPTTRIFHVGILRRFIDKQFEVARYFTNDDVDVESNDPLTMERLNFQLAQHFHNSYLHSVFLPKQICYTRSNLTRDNELENSIMDYSFNINFFDEIIKKSFINLQGIASTIFPLDLQSFQLANMYKGSVSPVAKLVIYHRWLLQSVLYNTKIAPGTYTVAPGPHHTSNDVASSRGNHLKTTTKLINNSNFTHSLKHLFHSMQPLFVQDQTSYLSYTAINNSLTLQK